MNAQKAREKATVRSQQPYTDIMKAIEQAVSKGKMECYYSNEIPYDTKKILEDDGYNIGVTLFDNRGIGYSTKISW